MSDFTESMISSLAELGATGNGDAFRLATGAGVAWRAPEHVNGDTQAGQLAARCVRAAAVHAHQRRKIEADPTLTAVGKAPLLERTDREGAVALDAPHREALAWAAAAEAALARELEPPALARDDAVQALHDREARQWLSGLNLAEAIPAITSSPALAAAILRSPVPQPEPLIEAARRQRELALRATDRGPHLFAAAEHGQWLRTVAEQSLAAWSSVATRPAAPAIRAVA